MLDRELTVLARGALAPLWPTISTFLDSALQHSEGELSSDDIRTMVENEQAFILVVVVGGEIKAAGAVEITQYPRFKVANIIAVGGDCVFLKRSELEWLKMLCKDMNIRSVQTYCRPSMARLLNRLGMRDAYRVMRLDT